MSFKIHHASKHWAQPLFTKESPIKTQMDIYYLSFIVGISTDSCVRFEPSQVVEITRDYTDSFKPFKYTLLGILLSSELKSSGLKLERSSFRDHILKFIDCENSTMLNERAFDLMNRYAFGGFEYIRNKLSTSVEASTFLVWFYEEFMSELIVNSGLVE